MTFNITCKHCGTVQSKTTAGGTWISCGGEFVCWYCKRKFNFYFPNPKKDFNIILWKKYRIYHE